MQPHAVHISVLAMQLCAHARHACACLRAVRIVCCERCVRVLVLLLLADARSAWILYTCVYMPVLTRVS